MAQPRAKKDTIYEVTVGGEYYAAQANGQKVVKPYTITLRLDLTPEMKQAGPLCIIRREILKEKPGKPFLPRTLYPDWLRYRTHRIENTVHITTHKPATDLRLMNRAQLLGAIGQKGLPIDGDLYPEITDLRQAVQDYIENPEAFEARQEKRRETHGVPMQLANSIMELNAELFGIAPAHTPANAQTHTPTPTDDPIPLPGFDEKQDFAELLGVGVDDL